MKLIEHQDSPRYLKLHEDDNVAIVVNEQGVARGSRFPDGLITIEGIPQSHKVMLHDLPAGGAVIRYGTVIGHAINAIPQGSWVRETLLSIPEAPPLNDRLPMATATPPDAEPLTGYTFEGFRNPDGSVGTRNILGVTTTVQCVAGVLGHCVSRVRHEILPKYPNVDDVVALTHTYGCGVAINAPDAAIPIRTLLNISRNPNLGAQALVISLGCEKLQAHMLMPGDELTAGMNEQDWLYRLQDATEGFTGMVEQIMAMMEDRLKILDRRRRETCPAADLIVGMQCGGSDAFSGVTANPGLGKAADLLVRAGATVMFSENTEVRDGVHLLTPRAATPQVARDLVRELEWYDEYLDRGRADRTANTSPGNKKGGLNNIVEKAMGSIAKSGSSAISGVVPPGERVKGKGLQFCATPAGDFMCGTLQLAAGMNLHIFTTGRGSPYGLSMVPVIKVSTRTELANRWPDLIDVDAGRVTSGRMTLDELGWEIFQLYLDVASGRKQTWTEKHKIHNDLALFNPGPVT